MTATTTGVATPAAFSLTNTVSAFVDLAFVQQPSNTTAGVAISPPVTVRVTDSNGNPVGGAAVTVGIFASSRSIQGTIIQTTDGSGIATFADLKVQTVGTYSLQATTGAVPPVGSNSFTVSPAAPRSIAVSAGSGQSAPVLTPFADTLKASVTDEFGNVVPAVAVTFAAPRDWAERDVWGRCDRKYRVRRHCHVADPDRERDSRRIQRDGHGSGRIQRRIQPDESARCA